MLQCATVSDVTFRPNFTTSFLQLNTPTTGKSRSPRLFRRESPPLYGSSSPIVVAAGSHADRARAGDSPAKSRFLHPPHPRCPASPLLPHRPTLPASGPARRTPGRARRRARRLGDGASGPARRTVGRQRDRATASAWAGGGVQGQGGGAPVRRWSGARRGVVLSISSIFLAVCSWYHYYCALQLTTGGGNCRVLCTGFRLLCLLRAVCGDETFPDCGYYGYLHSIDYMCCCVIHMVCCNKSWRTGHFQFNKGFEVR